MDSPAVSLIRSGYDAINQAEWNWTAEHLPPDFEVVPTLGAGGRYIALRRGAAESRGEASR